MFNLFKRAPSPPVKAKTKLGSKPATTKTAPGQPCAATAAPPYPHEPVALPEVVEGNEVTDWALWEDSMTALDSQMQSLTPSARIYEKDKRTPSQFQEIEGDAFASVRPKRGV